MTDVHVLPIKKSNYKVLLYFLSHFVDAYKLLVGFTGAAGLKHVDIVLRCLSRRATTLKRIRRSITFAAQKRKIYIQRLWTYLVSASQLQIPNFQPTLSRLHPKLLVLVYKIFSACMFCFLSSEHVLVFFWEFAFCLFRNSALIRACIGIHLKETIL